MKHLIFATKVGSHLIERLPVKKLFIIDISSFIFRAFYAIRPLTSPEGIPVNAVHGVWNMIYKLITEYKPTHIFVAQDTKAKTFRHKLYEEYKANRQEPPDELKPQFEIIFELINRLHIPMFGLESLEADDLIGSAVVQWRNYFDEIVIVSSDKDLMQFVGGKVTQLDTMKEKLFTREEVKEKMGVWPEQIADYLSLVGDSSDNIPGVRGIGPKGAAGLLNEYGTLDKALSEIENISSNKLKNSLLQSVEELALSRKLVAIEVSAKLGHSPEETLYNFNIDENLLDFFRKYGFNSALTKLKNLSFESQKNVEKVANFESKKSLTAKKVVLISGENLAEQILEIQKSKTLGFVPIFDSSDIINRELKALSVYSNSLDLTWYCEDEAVVHTFFESILENEFLDVNTPFAKRIFSYAHRKNIRVKCCIYDLIQLHYLLLPDESHVLESLMKRNLDVEWPKKDDFYFLNLKMINALPGNFAEDSDRLSTSFHQDLLRHELLQVYKDIDFPLISILAKMENIGISVDGDYLKELEKKFTGELDEIEKDIFKEANATVNLNSPKQVGHLLFEQLKLPVIKKTKTGYSTDSEVLEELDALGTSVIPAKILKYRELDKLVSTYVSVLPRLISERTKRLHTTFSLHTAATGRLSSLNPNLQNIPIRTEAGRQIRKAFVAGEDHVLLSADYSQVELRILAHFSKDPTMLKAFRDGLDIHAQTASEVLGIDIAKVTKSDRSLAKAVNFGLMYGQSSFGLAAALKISRNDAKEYITKYFTRFGSVKSYLDSLKEFAEIHGYSKTLHGRKRFLPDIKSTNRMIKSQAERVAINSPIQGTAADIIKIAMIQIDQEIEAQKLKSKMLLQVHDELIFEVPSKEVELMKKLVKEKMEGVVKMEVPLIVDVGTGKNWLEID